MKEQVKWAAELDHVREVSLVGSADLYYWKERLEHVGLDPAEREGRAAMMIVAAEGKFLGVRFRELSISVEVVPPADVSRSALLLHAFNSVRFFAFCERTFFSTPYQHADVRITHSLPAAVGVIQNGIAVFQAQMQDVAPPAARTPFRQGDEEWEGWVILPQVSRVRRTQGKMFFARLRGQTQVYRFLPEADTLKLEPQSEKDVFSDLVRSHFVAHQWVVRANATHAKSKTYRRPN
jgi:hypothetical protein